MHILLIGNYVGMLSNVCWVSAECTLSFAFSLQAFLVSEDYAAGVSLQKWEEITRMYSNGGLTGKAGNAGNPCSV